MYKLIRPLLFLLDPEIAHTGVHIMGNIASTPLFTNLIEPFFHFDHPSLHTRVTGIAFTSPVGLAAGFDKNGEMLRIMNLLGFGFLEIGSVTAHPTNGNPKPRLFRLPADNALVNRMGLNNDGVERISQRLQESVIDIPVGVNIAKTNDIAVTGEQAIRDYCYSYGKLPECCKYIVLNISCPNTADGKTFEDADSLAELLSAVNEYRKSKTTDTPLFLKISADLSYKRINSIVEVAKKYNVSGFVVSNTSLERSGLRTDRKTLEKIGHGGLSGAPIKEKSTELIRYIYRNFGKPTIIGVGGIFSEYDAYEKIKAGASLVQIYTSLVYEGPSIVKKIKTGLVRLLERDGFSSVERAVGCELP